MKTTFRDNEGILKNRYNNVQDFLYKTYNININAQEQIKSLVNECILFDESLQVWQRHLHTEFIKADKIDFYFNEMISNTKHIMTLSALNMYLPSLIMLRRTQELLLIFLYYSEHPVELYRKEYNENDRILSGFDELKKYVISYPFKMKYNISDNSINKFVKGIISDWSTQYSELSNFVHASNSKYFKNINYLDDFKFEKKNINFISKQINELSSILNSLFIVFYFSKYILFDEYDEKTLIRKSISPTYNYKNCIVDIFKEI